MILILFQTGCRTTAERTASDLGTAFGNHVSIRLLDSATSCVWPAESAWDDLLIVVYDGSEFPASGNSFISQFIKDRPNSAILLPVAVNPAAKSPPEAARTIKALEFDREAEGPSGRLARRVGAMLGLRLQARDGKVFISYRTLDGENIATQIHEHLLSFGYRPFLDSAREIDGETTILPGSPVQKQIDDGLTQSNLVLLIDTPSAPNSVWIKHEVDTARTHYCCQSCQYAFDILMIQKKDPDLDHWPSCSAGSKLKCQAPLVPPLLTLANSTKLRARPNNTFASFSKENAEYHLSSKRNSYHTSLLGGCLTSAC